MIKICNKIVEYSFYSLFLLVPLAFTSATSELFELNKMWFTWALTIIICAAWFIKMVLQKKILFQRTPLDIPIGLFLVSQIIATIFSLDFHTSLWGYYSRFNGGLLSTVSYILLYYAFLSNFEMQKTGDSRGRAPDNAQRSEHWREGNLRQDPSQAVIMTKRLLLISLISGLIVALWGLPSHFGYDPTCLLFRGTFDVSCWTADFMPIVRIFSTLGQPDWLAAYLAILIPIGIAFGINHKSQIANPKQIQNSNNQKIKHFEIWNLFGAWNLKFVIFTGLTVLFYVDLLYTRARSGFLGIWLSLLFFFTAYFWIERKKPKLSFSVETLKSPLSIFVLGFLIITFVIGTPISQLHGFTLEGITKRFQTVQSPTPKTPDQSFESGEPVPRSSSEGGTESADIRFLVWTGAINAWKANPIFGTGVETFAFAYYKHKPAGQNLTSEWNFLYNKAHNEYLNYLATTGIVGLGTYLGMIGFFLTIVMLNLFQHLNSSKNGILKRVQDDTDRNLILALIASYISILITNFFGFSVVMTNVYLFIIPAFVFVLTGMIKPNLSVQPTKSVQSANSSPQIDASIWQWTPIFLILATSCFLLFALFQFWRADVAFALGYNLDRAGEYQKGYPYLQKAVKLRGGEPVFKDELSINNAIIASGLMAQKDQDENAQKQTVAAASALAQEAINTSNEVISQHSNNAVFWKTRVRLFFTLSQVDSRYLPRALDGIKKASLLAPQDANIWYNLGVLYGQNNNIKEGISALEKTIILKPNYRDARYALGLFYHTASLDESGKVVINDLNKKAIAQMQYILEHISSKDTDARSSFENWAK